MDFSAIYKTYEKTLYRQFKVARYPASHPLSCCNGVECLEGTQLYILSWQQGAEQSGSFSQSVLYAAAVLSYGNKTYIKKRSR